MNEPTGGDWHVRHWASKPLISIYADGQRIADMAPGGLLESHTNARYMAAAKEAIEALEAMIDRFGILEDNPMIHEETKAVSRQARAVIAKAKGES